MFRKKKESKTDRERIKIPDVHELVSNAKQSEEKKEDSSSISLKNFTASIALAVLNAKVIADSHAMKVKKDVYERDELMRHLPITTFDLSEVEIELRFLVEDIEEEGDVLITTDPEKLASLQTVLSTMKFKLTSKPLTEYSLTSGERLLRD